MNNPGKIAALFRPPPACVGVLTFARCINYGSYWQSRCLLQALRAQGHAAVLLDHRSSRVDRAEWRCALAPVPGSPAGATDRRRYARKTRKFLDALEQLPWSRPFPLDAPSRMEAVDTVVVGSDEVWNLMHPWYGGQPIFFGAGMPARRLVAYGASCGNYPAAHGLAPSLAGLLQAFDHLSVRDGNALSLVRQALGRTPALVLDPCLLLPAETPCQTASLALPAPRTLAVYGHGFSAGFAARVRRWARERDMTLVSIGYRNDWCDVQWLEAGPQEFADFISGAEAVATNFFHGCVFALRHGKPFACEASSYRAIKIRDLLALLGAEDRLTSEATPAERWESCLSQPPGEAVENRLAALRRLSLAYLARALEARQPASPALQHAAG